MKVLLVNGFDSDHAIVELSQRQLDSGGHEVTRLDLVDQGFGRYMTAEERRVYHDADNLVTPETKTSAQLVRTHDGLLVCCPIIEGAVAPCVKSWFERVFIPEVSFTFTKSGRITGALRHVQRVGMIVDCDEHDRTAHRRRASARSIIRSVRMNSKRTCRSTYVAIEPGDDAQAVVPAALARW